MKLKPSDEREKIEQRIDLFYVGVSFFLRWFVCLFVICSVACVHNSKFKKMNQNNRCKEWQTKKTMSNTNKILSWLARIWERIFGPLMELSMWLTYCLFNYSNIFGGFLLLLNIRNRFRHWIQIRLSVVWPSTQHEHKTKSHRRWYWYRFSVDEPTNRDLVCIYVYSSSSPFINYIEVWASTRESARDRKKWP